MTRILFEALEPKQPPDGDLVEEARLNLRVQQSGRKCGETEEQVLSDTSLPRFDEEDLLRVRTRIYEAIGDLDELPSALMAVARRLNAAHASVSIPTFDPKLGRLYDAVCTGPEMSATLSSAQRFGQVSRTHDPWTAGMLDKFGARPGRVFVGDQLCPREAILKSPWQSEVLIPNDVGDLLVATLRPISAYKTPVAQVAFFRSRRAPRFERDAAERLILFVRDIERMVRMAFMLRAHEKRQGLLMSALNRTPNAVFVVRADGEILLRNDAGAALLERSAGLASQDGKLSAVDHDNRNLLASAVMRAVLDAEGADIALKRTGRPPLFAIIAPVFAAAGGALDPGAAVVAFVEPSIGNA